MVKAKGMKVDPSELITATEAAKLLGYSGRAVIQDAIVRGALPAIKIGGRYVLRLEDVRAYAERVRDKPAPGRSVRK